MNRSRVTKIWILLGVLLVMTIWHFSRSGPAKNRDEETPIVAETDLSAPTEMLKSDAAPQGGGNSAETPTASGEASQQLPSDQSETSGVEVSSAETVYIGHTDREALQPGIVDALRQLADTSHSGLQVHTAPNGMKIVDTLHKFRHVAVAAITPDRKIIQQDFSTAP